MTVSISYAQFNIGGGILDATVTSIDPSITALSNGGWIAANTRGGGITGAIGLRDGSSTPHPGTFLNSTTTGIQQNSELAGLLSGGYVGVFEDFSSGTAVIRGRIFDASGLALAADFDISGAAFQGGEQLSPDVTTLANGNFVVVWQDDDGPTDHDIVRAIYSPSGVFISYANIDGSSGNDSFNPKVAALSGGGYAVVWHNLLASGSTQVWTAVYSSTGAVVTAPAALATTGVINRNASIAATPDGGFVVVLEDSVISDAQVGTDINLIKVNSTGNVTSFVNASIGVAPAGGQVKPAVTVLDNGFIMVGWTNDAATPAARSIQFQMFDTSLAPINVGTLFASASQEVALTSLPNGGIATAWALSNGTTGYALLDIARVSESDAADDLIQGDAWRDVIYGGAGNDFIIGGAGSDSMDGQAGFDSVSWLGLQAGALINLYDQSLNAFAAAGDVISNFEAYYLTDFGDSFTNNNRDGYMYGFAGNDIITGGSGTDFIDGGVGGDQISAGAGFDYVSYSNAAAGVTVNMITPGANSGEAAGDVITGAEAFYLSAHNDTFIGQSGQNFVFAGNGVDVLYGGVGSSDWLFGEAGNDFLAGGDFDDLLSGGAGNDTYAFNSWVGNGFDSILNFTSGADKIQLGAAGFGLTAGQSFTAGANFISAASPFATTAAGTLLYATGLGILYYDPDGSGAIGAIALAQFSGAPAIAAGDFYVV